MTNYLANFSVNIVLSGIDKSSFSCYTFFTKIVLSPDNNN